MAGEAPDRYSSHEYLTYAPKEYLCAQQPLNINHASSEKCSQESPSKAGPGPEPQLQRGEVNVVVNEPNKKSCDNSKDCP